MELDKQLINITDTAINKFKEMLFDAGQQESYLKISLELEGTKMYYNMDIKEDISEDEKLYYYQDLKVLVSEDDEILLDGLNIDYIEDENGVGFTLDNPNNIEIFEDDGGCCGRGCCC